MLSVHAMATSPNISSSWENAVALALRRIRGFLQSHHFCPLSMSIKQRQCMYEEGKRSTMQARIEGDERKTISSVTLCPTRYATITEAEAGRKEEGMGYRRPSVGDG